VPRTAGWRPRWTSAASWSAAFWATRLLPVTVRWTYRYLPVPGWRPEETRTCHRFGPISRMLPDMGRAYPARGNYG
jgi:hypothetical protein